MTTAEGACVEERYKDTLRPDLGIMNEGHGEESYVNGRQNSSAARLLIRRQGKPRRTRHASDAYYGDSGGSENFPDNFTRSLPTTEDIKKSKTEQSRRLPYWAWYILAKSLGIRLHPGDNRCCGLIMITLTVIFAVGFAISHLVYSVYDILSIHTKQTVLTGFFSIVINLYWCCLGIYAYKLAVKLFSSQKFVDSVRLHSKTIFKISAVGLLILIGIANIVLNNYSSEHTFEDSYCIQNVTVSVVVCKFAYVTRVGFSVFSLSWNLLVGIVMLSVCRTHTIGIRRFIKQLEQDGKVYDSYRRQLYMQGPHSRRMVSTHDPSGTTDDETPNPWEDEPAHSILPASPGIRNLHDQANITGVPSVRTSADHQNINNPLQLPPNACEASSSHAQNNIRDVPTVTAEGYDNIDDYIKTDGIHPPLKTDNRPIIIIRAGSASNSVENERASTSSENTDQSTRKLIQPDPPSLVSRSSKSQMDSPQHSTRVEMGTPRRARSSLPSCDSCDVASSSDASSVGVHMMTVDDILINYWRISCRLRSTSMALQRWLVAWICFIFIWTCTFLIYWVGHEATLLDIAEFVLPILLLPLLCSAYGEVNNDGRRVIKCICPTSERMDMMFFLMQQPLEVTAFGFPINYSTVVKALGAVALAFCTRIILDEFNFSHLLKT